MYYKVSRPSELTIISRLVFWLKTALCIMAFLVPVIAHDLKDILFVGVVLMILLLGSFLGFLGLNCFLTIALGCSLAVALDGVSLGVFSPGIVGFGAISGVLAWAKTSLLLF